MKTLVRVAWKYAFLLSIFLINIFIQPVAAQVTNKVITISVNKAPLVSVFDEITKQTGLKFFYTEEIIGKQKNAISLDFKSADIDAVLRDITKKTKLYFLQEGNTIAVSKDEFLNTSANTTVSNREKITVSGTITDSNNEPAVGSSVKIKGTTTGALADVDGNYSILVDANDVIEINFIGYLSQTISVNGKEKIDIVLKEDIRYLEEVVVVGYGTQKKVNLTGAITSVKSSDIENIPSSNLSNSLAGRAPGVNITGVSGMAGASSTIRMRGSMGEPLFVINNVIKGKSDFDALDPNEVENVSFLKDAASASIYGSKAGNGVVLVTTKRGTNQKPEFQYKGSTTLGKTTRPVQNYSATDELIWANRVSETKGLPIRYGKEIFDYFADKSYNINDYVWQDPTSQQHNVSVNGGNDRISYFMMLGYHDEDGSYKNLEYKKYNFRSDVTAHISNRFKVNFNISGNQRDYKRFYWPYDDVDNFTVPDFYRATFNWSRLFPFFVDDDGNPTDDTNANPVTPDAFNPVQMVIGNHYQKTTRRTLDAQMRFDLDLGQYVEGLNTSLFAHYTAYDDNLKSLFTHNKSYRFQSASSENIFKPGKINPDDVIIHNLGQTYEGIRENVNLSRSYQINYFLNYARKFENHAVSGMFVFEQSESSGKNIGGSATDMLTPNIDQIFVTSGNTARRSFYGSESESARQSYVGRFNYTYDDKYIVEFSFRQDGNYKFAPSQRWGFFPSGSLAWRMSEENFMSNISWLSNLKLRGSYGTTGDDNNWDGNGIAAFQWREYYRNGNGYYFGDDFHKGIAIGSTPNPFISWAELKVYNIGLDYGMLNNRLTGEIDYYHKNKNHILKARNRVVPGTYGGGLSNENYAEQEWDGFEFSFRWADTYKDFKYDVYGNMGYVKDKWLKLDEPEGLENWRSAIGRPNSRIQGLLTDGIIRTQADLDAIPDGFTQFGRKPILGTILYKDIRGANYSEGADGKIDSNDVTYLSDLGSPRINYGFGFNVEWKGIAVNAHFQGVGSFDRMLSTKNGGGVFQVDNKPYFELWTKDVWTPDNINAKYPRVSGQWQEEYGAASSQFWLRDGAYMRLKNLNVAYTLPKHWLSSQGVNKIQVFFNATNLFYISSIAEMDPEQGSLDSYPMMKSFTGGLSINF